MEVTKEQLEIIHKVVDLHFPKYKVEGYEPDDIKQEAYLLAFDCLKIWDEAKGEFEHFLNHYLFCRLKNLVRNLQYKASKYTDIHKAVMNASDITEISVEEQQGLVDRDNVVQNLEVDELVKKIDYYLPVALRRDYLRLKAGVKINRGRAKKIRLFIKTLLEELSGEREEDIDG